MSTKLKFAVLSILMSTLWANKESLIGNAKEFHQTLSAHGVLPFLYGITLTTLIYAFFFIYFMKKMDANPSLYFYDAFFSPSSTTTNQAKHSSLHNKVILVAGASDGIGAEFAYQVSEKFHNCTIILMARTLKKLKTVESKCVDISKENKTNVEIKVLVCDVTAGEDHISEQLEAVLNSDGSTKSKEDSKGKGKKHIDVLVMSAGIAYETEFMKTEMKLVRAIFELNVLGAIGTTKAFLKHSGFSIDPSESKEIKTEKQIKNIILISSLAGKMPTALSAGYSASKGAVNLFYDTLRAELEVTSPPHLDFHVTTVCPGPVATNIFEASMKVQTGGSSTLSSEELEDIKRSCMTAKRCVQLIISGILAQGKLPKPFKWAFYELWVANQPLVLITFLNQFFPSVIKALAGSRMTKKRDW